MQIKNQTNFNIILSSLIEYNNKPVYISNLEC
jgi:hypothetical protein